MFGKKHKPAEIYLDLTADDAPRITVKQTTIVHNHGTTVTLIDGDSVRLEGFAYRAREK